MKSRRAFTLVEMIVATTMLALLVGAGFSVFRAGVRSAEKVKRVSRMADRGQLLLQTIADDLRMATAHNKFCLTSLDVVYEGRCCDTIDVIVPRRDLRNKEPLESGRCEVGYYIDIDPDTPEEWLVRREDRTVDDELLGGGDFHVVGPFVSELDFEFFDGLFWKNGWDETESFPKAIRIHLAVMDENNIERPMFFSTTVQIMAQ